MATHNEFGKLAEQLAYDYLIQNNYLVLERNWRFQKAELDLIAFDQNTLELVVIEVKSLHSDSIKKPEDAVHSNKKKLLILGIDAYLTQKNIDYNVRFDIISILIKNGKTTLKQLKDAFNPFEV